MMLSDEEERMLRTLAEGRGLTASDLLRQTIRDMHRTATGEPEKVSHKTRATPKKR